MKIPTKVFAFGRTYSVIRDNEITRTMECWGYLDSHKDVLAMRKRDENFTAGHERQVFAHEVFHIIDNNLHIGLSEEQIHALAIGFITIIEDNKLDFTSES